MKKRTIILLVAVVGAAGALLIPVGPSKATSTKKPPVPGMDLSAFSDAKPDPVAGAPLRVLFIHHSCGGQLLAPEGPDDDKDARCIYLTAKNGGGLRPALEAQGYEVHEASYGSEIGDKTDMFDWLPKFRDKMDKVLTVDKNDTFYTDGRKNQIVVFKSCFTEAMYDGEGEAPGNPAGPERTEWNRKAEMTALLPIFAAHPETLFVFVTSPPAIADVPKERLWKWLLKTVLGKPHPADRAARDARLHRDFNDWAKSPDGWLAGYEGKNVVVFDYYDVLTNHGETSFLAYEADGDRHPTADGNKQAAAAMVPFFNRAVRYAGLSR